MKVRRELPFLILVFLISSIPSVAGIMFPPPGGVWTGILTRNTADVNGYLGIIEEVRQGHLRSRNLFTSEPHPPFQIRPYYTLLGLAGRVFPHISTVALLELGRAVSVLALLWLILAVSRTMFRTSREIRITFLIVSLGSGIGWLNLVYDSPDLRIVDISTFLVLLSPPLYSVSLFLILAILFCLSKSWEEESEQTGIKYSILAGLLAFWLGLDRPFSLATIAFAALACLLFNVVQRQRMHSQVLQRTALLAAGALLAFLYQFQVLRSIPVYAEWNRQHLLLTPDLPRLLTAYGLMIPLALVGVRPLYTRAPFLTQLLCFYAMGSLILSHLPLQFQERFLEGLPLCLAFLAASGSLFLLDKLRHSQIRFAGTILLVLLLTPSNFIALTRDLEAIARQSPPQYMPERALEAMQRLVHLSKPEEAIMCSEASGNFIVGHAARPVVLGHRIQTARYAEKRTLVETFFQTEADDPRARELFGKSGARWLFWGPEEAWLSHGVFEPAQSPFLKEAYNNGFVRLFQLKDSHGTSRQDILK